MPLPQDDPSLPGGAAPLFSDTDAARGDHLRANNQLIWENCQYLQDGYNIADATAKTTPIDADVLPLADSAAANIIKKLTFANLFVWIVAKVYALTGKTTPVDADGFLITDSAASNVGKLLTWANLKATMLTYFQSVAGTVLQEVTATDAGGTTTSTSLTNLNVANVSITPKSTNSIILVDVQFYASEDAIGGTNTLGTCRLYETTTSSSIGADNFVAAAPASDGAAVSIPANIRARLTNAALTTRTFQLRGKTSNGSAAFGAQSMVWSIREIQA